jgi:DNA-binding transcriptional LysR family regulator
LSAYADTHPRVDVRVREVDTHVGIELLRRREIDVALIRQFAPPHDCEHAVLRRERLVLATPGDWELPRELSRDLALAAELPWIWVPRDISPDYHDQVAACCRAAGFTPRGQHFAGSINSQLAMVASGLGVALVPANSVGAHQLRGAVKVIRVSGTTTIDLAAVWRRTTNRLVSDFLLAIKQSAA